MTSFRTIVAAAMTVAIAGALLLPAAADAKSSSRKRTKITVHSKNRHWHGYGFLPGYRPSLAESQGVPILGPDPRPKEQYRYWDFSGNVRYGWGYPGFAGGRWNGGSFGPCWTSTPIGMQWNCGR